MHDSILAMGRPLPILINSQAGTAKESNAETLAEGLKGAAAELGIDAQVELIEGDAIGHRIGRLKREGGAVIVGGGDGTISSSAAQLAGSDTALGVLPLGTMNLFARALKIPLDPVQALKSLLGGEEAMVDTGTMNGRLFLHQVSLGLQPKMVKLRETMSYGSRAGKILASWRAFVRTLRRPPSLSLEAEAEDGRRWQIKAPALVVSNNLLLEGLPPVSARLDEGILGVYTLQSTTWPDLLSLTKDVVMGQWQRSALMDVREVEHIAIARARRPWKSMTVSVDGELIRVKGRIDIAIKPKSLRVLRPREDKAS